MGEMAAVMAGSLCRRAQFELKKGEPPGDRRCAGIERRMSRNCFLLCLTGDAQYTMSFSDIV